MSEYAKHIQTIEDMWKKRIELREEGGGRMSEYTWRELERADMDTAAAHAAEMEHRERLAHMEHIVDGLGEVKGEIVRCRDCDYRRRHWNGHVPNFKSHFFCAYTGGHEVKPDGFCAWGVRRDG